MLFFEKYGNAFVRIAAFIQALVFALVPFLFIKEKLSAPSWSPGFFAYLCILMMVGGSLYMFYFTLFYHRIRRKRELQDRLLKREQLKELADIQEERFRNPRDTTTVILLDNVTDYGQLEKLILDSMTGYEGTLENVPLLWKRGEGRYAITEDETQWNINPEDAMLYRSKRHDKYFQPRPEIDWTRLEKMMI